jgi:hypothetical protein
MKIPLRHRLHLGFDAASETLIGPSPVQAKVTATAGGGK